MTMRPEDAEVLWDSLCERGEQMEKKADFVRKLAEYVAGPNQAEMSIKLQMGDPAARLWADIRSCTPLFGYPTTEEAIPILADWLGIDMGDECRK